MRHRLILLAILALTLAAAAGPALAQAPPAPPEPSAAPETPPVPDVPPVPVPDVGGGAQETSLGGSVEVLAGERRHGDVVVIGGSATIDGEVLGDVVVIGGSMRIGGSVMGDCVGVGTRIALGDAATINGDVVNVGGALERGRATVRGEVVNLGFGKVFPGAGPLGILGAVFFWAKTIELLTIFLCLLVLAALVPERVRLIADETPVRWPAALLAGIGGYVGLFLVQFLLVITLIGIPIAILLWFVFVVLKALALAGVFAFVGSRIGRMFGREMSLLGAVLLGFLPFALVRYIPFLGLVPWMILQLIAVGMLLLTRAGGRGSAPAAPEAPPPAVPVVTGGAAPAP